MENYKEFLNRINNFEKLDFSLDEKYFTPDPSIHSKVDENNEFREFYGDTTVFDLDEDCKNKISQIIDMLYLNVPECFCEKRVTDTLHMTMHDLSNSINKEDVETEIENNYMKLKNILKENPIVDKKIKMKTNFIRDFGHVSLVLAL